MAVNGFVTLFLFVNLVCGAVRWGDGSPLRDTNIRKNWPPPRFAFGDAGVNDAVAAEKGKNVSTSFILRIR